LLALAVLAAMVAACGGGGVSPRGANDPARPTTSTAATSAAATTRARPALFASLPQVELLAPEPVNAGRAPTFRWATVPAAATYRVAVLAPDAPSWAWTGTETSVRYGGVAEGANGPSLRPGSWWSVAALASDGAIVAISDLRAVSPGGDPGPPPTWTERLPDAAAPSASAPPTGSIAGRWCDLLTPDEIAAAIGGEWPGHEPFAYAGDSGGCDWTSSRGSKLSLSVQPRGQYDPDGWGADETIDGLGEQAYRVNHGFSRRIGFAHGEYSVTLTIDFTKVKPDGFLRLAQEVDGRLP
jgi:hypothetical protein